MKFLSMLLAQILIPSTELNAYSRSSLLMETQILHPYWYISFSWDFLLLVVYELVFKSFFKSSLFLSNCLMVCTCLPHKHRSGLCCSIPSTPFSLHALVYLALFFYACFASQTSGLFCSAIPSTPPVCTLYYIQQSSCKRTLPLENRVYAMFFLRLSLVWMLC